MDAIQNIVVIGSGNVAGILSPELVRAGISVLQVYSRNIAHANTLAFNIGAGAVDNIAEITDNADLYLFCVSDSALIPLLQQKNWKGKFLAHTAGSMPMSVFKPFSDRYGVLYPFQTFTKGRNINVSEIPFFIEAGSHEELSLLEQLAGKISSKCQPISSKQREIIHLAGVFANNFANYMLTVGENLLHRENLPVEWLRPIVAETFNKALESGPANSQTGPAVRNNIEILEKHIALLAQSPDWQKIYTFVSESIQKYYRSHE